MADTKFDQQKSNAVKEERKLAALQAQKVKEQAFKLVVKIISWESGSMDSIVIKSDNKITQDEWLKYRKQRMSIATEDTKYKAVEKLTQTYKLIKANGGFK